MPFGDGKRSGMGVGFALGKPALGVDSYGCCATLPWLAFPLSSSALPYSPNVKVTVADTPRWRGR